MFVTVLLGHFRRIFCVSTKNNLRRNNLLLQRGMKRSTAREWNFIKFWGFFGGREFRDTSEKLSVRFFVGERIFGAPIKFTTINCCVKFHNTRLLICQVAKNNFGKIWQVNWQKLLEKLTSIDLLFGDKSMW